LKISPGTGGEPSCASVFGSEPRSASKTWKPVAPGSSACVDGRKASIGLAGLIFGVAMEPWAARNEPSMPEVQSPPSGRGSNAVEPTPPPPLIIVTFIEPGVIDQRHCIGPCDGGDT